jgi:hypothetical protein
MKNKFNQYAPPALLGIAVLLSSCGTSGGLKTAQARYREGNIGAAAGAINSLARKHKVGDKDSEIVYLEQGNILAAAGHSADAKAAFVNADRSISANDDKAKIRLASEGAAMVNNLNSLPYRASPSERLMSASYLAASFLVNSEKEPALSAVKLAKNRQAQIFSEFENQINKDKAALQKAQQENKVQYKDEILNSKQSELLSSVSKYEGYKDYSVPYADALAGAILDVAKSSDTDSARARESFRRAFACYPGSSQLSRSASSSQSNMTHIFIEDGVAPMLGQVKLTIPIMYKGSFTTLSVATPTFLPQPLLGALAQVSVGGSSCNADLICDFDRLAGAEYKRKLPGTIARTTASAIVKAVGGLAAQEVAKQRGENAQLLVGLASVVYNEVSSQADERIWATLPKQVRYACVPTPSNGQITVGGQKVNVQAGKGNVVIARVTNGMVFARTSKL